MTYKIKDDYLSVINEVKEYDELIYGRFSQFETDNNIKTNNFLKFGNQSVEINIHGQYKKLENRIIKTDIYPIVNNIIAYLVNDENNMYIHSVVISKENIGMMILGNFGQGKSTLSREFQNNGYEIDSTDQTWISINNNKVFQKLGSRFDIVNNEVKYNENYGKRIEINKILRIVGLNDEGDTSIIKNDNKFHNIKNIATFCNWNYIMPIFTDDIELYNTNKYVKKFLENLSATEVQIYDVRGDKRKIYSKIGDENIVRISNI